MAGGDRIVFELRLGPWPTDALAVRRVRGSEALSEPFRFEVEWIPVAGDPVPLAGLPGAEATLCMRRPDGTERWIHGTCAAADLARVESGHPVYRAVLVPALLRLGSVEDCRVFQGQTVVEIVRAVLDRGGIEHRAALTGTYPVRDLCIQYRETDLGFVSRLLEEDGIVYWFEHRPDGHTMVLADAPTAFAPALGHPLPFRREVGAVAQEQHVYALRSSARLAPTSAVLRDYDFERPALAVEAKAQHIASGAEHYDHPSGDVGFDETRRRAQVRLERLRFASQTWSGESNSHQLAPGFSFVVEGHPDPAFTACLAVVRLHHEGRQERAAGAPAALEDAYRNRFVAAPVERAYRPATRTPRAPIHGPQTATVVGPPGEEIHVDSHGRIKIQFHWDRLGRRDDTASAWVRLAQPWAGAAMGTVVVPRAGQEVLVRFLEGNPDRPVVTGAVFNGNATPPVTLPGERTRSTFRSDTSPGPGGANELAFEDQAGAEQVYLHGQKDAVLEVRNDKRQIVRGAEQLQVDHDRSRAVLAKQALSVERTDAAEVTGSQALTVKGHRATSAGGFLAEAVTGDQSVRAGGRRELRIDGGAVESIGLDGTMTIGAAYDVNVIAAMTESVGGAKSVEVGQAADETVGKAKEERVGADREARVGGDQRVDVRGAAHVDVRRDRREQIGGKSSIAASKGATISTGRHTIRAERFSLVVGGKRILSLESSGLVLLSGTSVTVNGKAVALAAPSISKVGPQGPAGGAAATAEPAALQRAAAVARVRLVDQDGRPVVNEPFVVELSDGTTRLGMTNAQGEGQLPLPKAEVFKVHFPLLEKSTWRKK